MQTLAEQREEARAIARQAWLDARQNALALPERTSSRGTFNIPPPRFMSRGGSAPSSPYVSPRSRNATTLFGGKMGTGVSKGGFIGNSPFLAKDWYKHTKHNPATISDYYSSSLPPRGPTIWERMVNSRFAQRLAESDAVHRGLTAAIKGDYLGKLQKAYKFATHPVTGAALQAGGIGWDLGKEYLKTGKFNTRKAAKGAIDMGGHQLIDLASKSFGPLSWPLSYGVKKAWDYASNDIYDRLYGGYEGEGGYEAVPSKSIHQLEADYAANAGATPSVKKLRSQYAHYMPYDPRRKLSQTKRQLRGILKKTKLKRKHIYNMRV